MKPALIIGAAVVGYLLYKKLSAPSPSAMAATAAQREINNVASQLGTTATAVEQWLSGNGGNSGTAPGVGSPSPTVTP